MTTVIKSNSANAAILSNDDLALLEGANNYREHIKQKCEELLHETKRKCDQLLIDADAQIEQKETELKQQAKQQLDALSQSLRQENYDLVKEFTERVETQIFEICNKILTKLHIDTVQNTQLISLIKNELMELMNNGPVTIKANRECLSILEQELSTYQPQLIFQVDEKFKERQCQISDTISTIVIDINQCKDEIVKLLTNSSLA
jgi:F0F1-type ATP synthase membrane subunit b/b'